MAVAYSDEVITTFMRERKPLPGDYRGFRYGISSHPEAECVQSVWFFHHPALCPKNSNRLFRLRRYNGKSHEHTNRIEQDTFYGFHIPTATARYQKLGVREDSFAEATDRYSDFQGALRCLFEDCGIDSSMDAQIPLFEET